MKKILWYCLALFAVLALTPWAFADTVTGTGSNTFQTWTASDLNENGTPYWDHTSSDGSQANVGYYLLNTGYFSTHPPTYPGPGSALPFWGGPLSSGGTADPNFYFTSSGSSQAALEIEVAGLAGSNTFGWYDTSTGTMHQLFSGPDSAGAATTFTPTATYGFYFGTDNGTFFTQSSQNLTDTNDQHFALFQGANGSYWLGMEDLLFASSDKDYNDMVVTVSPAVGVPQVPEPATFLLLGLGLIGGAGVRKRFTK